MFDALDLLIIAGYFAWKYLYQYIFIFYLLPFYISLLCYWSFMVLNLSIFCIYCAL